MTKQTFDFMVKYWSELDNTVKHFICKKFSSYPSRLYNMFDNYVNREG